MSPGAAKTSFCAFLRLSALLRLSVLFCTFCGFSALSAFLRFGPDQNGPFRSELNPTNLLDFTFCGSALFEIIPLFCFGYFSSKRGK